MGATVSSMDKQDKLVVGRAVARVTAAWELYVDRQEGGDQRSRLTTGERDGRGFEQKMFVEVRVAQAIAR